MRERLSDRPAGDAVADGGCRASLRERHSDRPAG